MHWTELDAAFLIFLIRSGLFAFAHPLLRSRRGTEAEEKNEEKIFFPRKSKKCEKFLAKFLVSIPALDGTG
jgi:hypothetical protein